MIWTKDGEPLVTGETSQEGPSHTLRLSLEQREDFGVYRCTASNELGSSHQEVAVTGEDVMMIVTSVTFIIVRPLHPRSVLQPGRVSVP